MTSIRKTLVGLVGMLAAAGVPFAVLPLLANGPRPPDTGEYLTPTETLVLLYPCLVLIGTMLGIPIFQALRRLRLGRWWCASVTGLLLGIGVAALLLPVNSYSSVLPLLPLGVLCGLVFESIWRFDTHRRAPDLHSRD